MTSKDGNKMQQTESDKIWDEIKDLAIDMFSLPNQTVKQHVKRVKITPTELHLTLKSSAVIASLEEAISRDGRGTKYSTPKYDLEMSYGYTIIKRAQQTQVFKPESESK